LSIKSTGALPVISQFMATILHLSQPRFILRVRITDVCKEDLCWLQGESRSETDDW